MPKTARPMSPRPTFQVRLRMRLRVVFIMIHSYSLFKESITKGIYHSVSHNPHPHLNKIMHLQVDFEGK